MLKDSRRLDNYVNQILQVGTLEAKDKNYKELFGDRSSQLLSIYEHDHNHVHTADGNIEKNEN